MSSIALSALALVGAGFCLAIGYRAGGAVYDIMAYAAISRSERLSQLVLEANRAARHSGS